jgi:MATE family multidrug resistance protein
MSALDQTAAAAIADAAPPRAATWRAELRELFVLAWPLVLAQLAQHALWTTDLIVMGMLGAQYVAAGALANAYFFALQLTAIGIVGAVAPLVSQALGARDIKAVRKIVQAGLWMALVCAIIIVPIVWQAETVLLALGQDADTSKLAATFLHYAVWLVFPAFAIIAVRSFLSAHGATRMILLISIAGIVVNALGNYALVLGHWGFPRLELMGSGIVTTIVNAVMLGLMVLYVQRHRRFRRYHILARMWPPDWSRLREITRIGFPIGLMLLAEVGLFSVAAFMMGYLGTNEVAGHAIALQCAALAFMVPLGLSQATTVRVGLAYGRRDPEGIRKAGWTALALTLIFMSATCIAFIALPHTLVGFFLDAGNPANTDALVLGASYLVIAGLFQLVDGTQVAMSGALRGVSDTKWPLIIALVGYWLVGMPVAYVCGFILGWRGVGIWTGLAFGLAAVALVLVARFAMRERLGLIKWRAP